jgi:C4-dicarboxylate-specific signal transduction histidine kinase
LGTVASDINQLIESTIALLRDQLIVHRVKIETDLELGLPTVLGDPVQLQQVLLNFLVNAVDAMASAPVALRKIKVCTRANSENR